MSEDTTSDRGRRVVASAFMTLDGYMVGPDEDISWVVENFDPELQEDIAAYMGSEPDVFVFGRVTYEIFEAYWPNAVPYETGDALQPAGGREDPRIIRALNERPKVVFSRSLEGTGWSHARIVREGLEDEIKRLKHEPGKVVDIQGSASVVQALGRADLIDEYRLYLYPVLLGAGTPLFGKGIDRHDLTLSRAKPYDNGAVALTYERKA